MTDGDAIYVRLPRHIDAMAGVHRRNGQVYALRNVVVPSGTMGWEVNLADGTTVIVPRICGNLSMNRGRAIAQRPPVVAVAKQPKAVRAVAYIAAATGNRAGDTRNVRRSANRRGSRRSGSGGRLRRARRPHQWLAVPGPVGADRGEPSRWWRWRWFGGTRRSAVFVRLERRRGVPPVARFPRSYAGSGAPRPIPARTNATRTRSLI